MGRGEEEGDSIGARTEQHFRLRTVRLSPEDVGAGAKEEM